jgi:hypothetical protein
MDDLFQLLIFVGVIVLSLIAGGKKKKSRPQQPRSPRPPPQAAARPRPPQSRPRPHDAARPPQRVEPVANAPQREEVMENLLDILRGRVPMPEPAARPPPSVVQEDVDDEAVSLEQIDVDRAAAHQSFHDKYVEEPHEVARVSRPTPHRYRLTPRTAREAVVWTAIFTRPKGLD